MRSSGSSILPHGFKKLDQKKVFLLGSLSTTGVTDPWKTFIKNVIKKIESAQGSNSSIESIVNQAFWRGLERADLTPDYFPLPAQGPYLYCALDKSRRNDSSKAELIEELLLSRGSLAFLYPSNKILTNGESTIIERLYAGEVYDYDPALALLTLKIADTYRSFKVDKMKVLSKFKPKTKAEIRHLKVEFEPLSNGSCKLTWTEIVGEKDSMIPEPWEESADDSFDEEELIIEEEFAENFLSSKELENQLSSWYGELVVAETVHPTAGRLYTCFKLIGFTVQEESSIVHLHGEGSVSIEVDFISERLRKRSTGAVIGDWVSEKSLA